MIEFLLYDFIFFWTYVILSINICLRQKISLFNYRTGTEMEKGCKNLLIQLPISNMIAYFTKFQDVSSLRACLWYVIVFDFLQFAVHWLFHSRVYLYKKFHREHHKSIYGIPFSATIMDPYEYFMIGIVPSFLPLMFIPMTFLGWSIVNYLLFIYSILIHSPVSLPFVRSQHHLTHHLVRNKNFGYLLPWWDQFFNTETHHIPLSHIRQKTRRHYENIDRYP